MNLRDWRLRLRALLFRNRVEQELDEELQFHLASQAQRNRERGMSEADAKRNARRDFGGVDQVKEECRDVRGVHLLESLAQDVRYALRGFRRTPGFALTVIATIALGLGLNTTLFSFFNAYLLRPIAVHDPYQLYRFTWSNNNGQGHTFTWREFLDFQKENPALTDPVALRRLSFARVDGHLMLGQMVTGNYFSMLGVDAMLGRTLLPDDTGVAVLSAAAWNRKFASDPNILGKKILIHGHPLEIVGVAGADFRGVSQVPLDYWAPLTMAPQLEDGASLFGSTQPERLDIIGRLRPDLTLKQAQAALTLWAQHRTASAVRAVLRSQATILPLDPMIVAAFSPVILAFGLVLVIACANVANMMLARAASRQRELGIRLAMGAGRSRLIRQLLTESVLLALPASVAALWLSQMTVKLGERVLIQTLPSGFREFVSLVPTDVDPRVFAFMLVAAFVSALLFGLAPAIQATRHNLMQAARGDRLRAVLVVAQVTVSVFLLICAAVLLRTNDRMHRLDPGLRTRSVIEFGLTENLRAKAIGRISTEPGVLAIAAASKVPFTGSLARITVGPGQGSQRFLAGYMYASPEYFSVFQLPILRGRSFVRDEAAVAVISQATARRIWGTRDPLGQTLTIDRSVRRPQSLADPLAGAPAYTSAVVIGIARDAINGWVGDGTDGTCIYFPTTVQAPGNVLFARLPGDAEAARRRLEAALAAAVPGAINQVHSMDETLDAQLYPFRAVYWISSAVGVLALMLTLSGIYGVLSYLVSQRTKEIGIRVALGARPAAVARLVLAQSLRFAVTGAGIGAAAAWATIRLAAPQLDLPMFGSTDPGAFAMVLVLVIAASAAAAWIPSLRAARIEPLSTLRCD